MTFTIRELDSSTWDAFAELVERKNGIFGGRCCIGDQAGQSIGSWP